MKVYTLFNDESALFARISGLRAQVAEAGKDRTEKDPLHKKLADFDGKLDELRRRIAPPSLVATIRLRSSSSLPSKSASFLCKGSFSARPLPASATWARRPEMRANSADSSLKSV